MTSNRALAFGAATVVALILSGCRASDSAGSSNESSPSAALPTTESSLSAPDASSPAPDDTSRWLPFESERYGFSIAYPPGWEAHPSDGRWTFPKDTAWPEGMERSDWFYLDGADGAVAASAWSVKLRPGVSADEWFSDYCAVEVTPCDGTEPKTRASLDGHAGWFVRSSEPQAYFGIRDRIYLVVVWQPGDHPALKPYGGGRQLVETFVSTMRLPRGRGDQSQNAGLIDSWLDTSKWTTYVSDRYQFTIGHPEAWTVIEAGHFWDQATESIDNDSGAMEVFVPPDDTISIYLAAWAVDVDRGTTLFEWARVFCDQYVASCTDVRAMSEPASATAGDREGILLPWDDGMVAFYPTWYDDTGGRRIWEQEAPGDGRIFIVESGRPAKGPYHSRELIEAFSASLCIGCAG